MNSSMKQHIAVFSYRKRVGVKKQTGISSRHNGRFISLDKTENEPGSSEINRVVKESMDLAQGITTHYPQKWKSQIGHFNLPMTFTHAMLQHSSDTKDDLWCRKVTMY